jgi:hypothetical protein
LQNHITNNMQNPTVGDVIGGKKTLIKQYPVLPSSLQNKIIVIGKRYAALPATLQQKMIFSLNKDAQGYPQDSITVPWVKLNNHKVTLSFKPATAADEQTLLSLLPAGEITDISQLPTAIPAYLIQVIPELKVDGVLIKAGQAMTLGNEIDFGFDTLLVGRSTIYKRYKVTAGSFLSIAAIGGSVSTTVLNNLQAKLEQTKTTLQSTDPTLIGALTREDLLGDMFQAGTLGYYTQYITLSYLAGLQSNNRHILAGGTGSFGYEPNVDYIFGIPRTLKQGGIALNKPIINITQTLDNNVQQNTNYNLQIGLLSSALEHSTPEQMFTDAAHPGEAVSAVRAIQKATQQGQRIYQLTAQNITTALPNIHHDSATMSEIRNAVNAGKEVITHTDSIQVPGWSGAGYMIVDNETGEGAYKISGGRNGGDYTLAAEGSFAISTLATINNVLHGAKFIGVTGLVAGPISAYLFIALGMVTFLALLMAAATGPDFSAHQQERNLITLFTTVATIGAVLAVGGAGAGAAVFSILFMLHFIIAEIVVLLAIAGYAPRVR